MRRRIDKLEQSSRNSSGGADREGGGKTGRKPISVFKAIQNVTPLLEDKSRFREWNMKFINAMEQVNSKYEAALLSLMKWADAQSVPDVES